MILKIDSLDESELRFILKNALKLIDSLYEDIAKLKEQNIKEN